MRLSILMSGFTLVGAMLLAGAAQAAPPHHGHGHGHAEEEESEYPLSYTERPLTLPALTLAPQLELDVNHVSISGASGSAVESGMNLGASFGITRNLEVGAFFLPITFSPDAGYGSAEFSGNLQLFGTFRFLHQREIEMGARLRVFVLTPRNGLGAGTVIEPSVPLLLHLGKIARLDVEVGVPIFINGTDQGATQATFAGLDVPVAFSVDIAPPFHVGVRSGVTMFDFGHAKESATVPLGFFAGFAIGGRKPIIDLDPFFNWSYFLTPGGGFGNDKINAGIWQVGLSARAYIYL